MKLEIKCRYTDSVLFEHDAKDNSIKIAVTAAVEKKVSLSGAYLSGADLSGADLSGAYLSGADLSGAYLRGAYLRGAYLSGAYLRGAYLRGAYLRGADLSGAYLSGAYLSGAYLSGAKLADGLEVDDSPRPFFYIGMIGSESGELLAFSTNKGIYLKRGCFLGTVAEFEAALEKKHDGNEHGKEYAAALVLIKLHFKLWKK